MAITKLNSNQLYRKCDPAKFEFNSTADLEERLSALGQDRAISAVELGIHIKSRGYNLFCLGPEGTGKTSLVKRIWKRKPKNAILPMIGRMFIILMSRINRKLSAFRPVWLAILPKMLMN